jgi:hypothetical protein
MQLLAGSSDKKKTTGSFSLKFNAQKVKLEMLIEDPACTKRKFKEKKKGERMQNLIVDKHCFSDKASSKKGSHR